MSDHQRVDFIKMLDAFYGRLYQERLTAAVNEIGNCYFQFVEHFDYFFIRSAMEIYNRERMKND